MSDWEVMEVLVTVKAYPSVSGTYGEAVCVAGVRLDTPTPHFVRFFPVGYRDLLPEQRFHKYQVIRLRARKHSSDRRMESYRPDVVVCRGFGDSVEGGLSAGDFVEDLVGGFGPDEGLGVVVPVGDPAVDPGFEFGDGGEAGVGQGFAAEHGEPALDEVEP